LVFIAKRWVKCFGIEDKDVEKRKNIYMYMCVHTKKEREKREERKEKEKREKQKREKDRTQGKKDIMRDDKSSEDQEKCEEGYNDVENESSLVHTMCNPTSRTSLVP
jgi:hypothetical protein